MSLPDELLTASLAWFHLLTRCFVLDVVFVALTLVFFAVSIGYVAACERLMK